MPQMAKSITSEVIHLLEWRLSFPRLDKPKAFQPGQDPRFEATFLGDPSNSKHAEQIARLKSEAGRIAREFWGAKFDEVKTQIKQRHLGNGNEKSYDGYKGMVYVATHNTTRPTIVDRRRNPVQPGDPQWPYGGCYVNATVTLWTQDNQYGKAINVNLRAIQFVKDGQAFGGAAPVDADEEFDALEGDGEGAPAVKSDPFA